MRIAILFLFVISLSSLVSALNTTDNSSEAKIFSGFCYDAIRAPGTYVLVADLGKNPDVNLPAIDCSFKTFADIAKKAEDPCNVACLSIIASNVILDCQGHTLAAEGVMSGIMILPPSTNVTIKNCIIDRPNVGVGIEYGWYSNGNLFENNTVNGALTAGYFLCGSDTIVDCMGREVTRNDMNGLGIGIQTVGVPFNPTNLTIKNCVVENFADGMFIVGSRNIIYQNFVYNAATSGYDIGLDGADTLISNNFYSQQQRNGSPGYNGIWGFFITGFNNSIIGNKASGAGRSCFDVSTKQGIWDSNRAENCDVGFFIKGNDNIVTNNTANGNKRIGFFIESEYFSAASGNVLANNIAMNNGQKDYDLDPEKNTMCTGNCSQEIQSSISETNATQHSDMPINQPGLSPTATESGIPLPSLIGIVVLIAAGAGLFALAALAAWFFLIRGKGKKKKRRG